MAAAALNIRLRPSSSLQSSTSPSLTSCHPASSSSIRLYQGLSRRLNSNGQGQRAMLAVRSSLEPKAVQVVGQVTEVKNDTFWPLVKEAGDKVVVLDMYTQWCGPCKVIAPKFQQLSEKYINAAVFMKLDCHQESKLAKELGIKVVPTFKILKEGKIVKEVTGAKIDDLVLAIEEAMSA